MTTRSPLKIWCSKSLPFALMYIFFLLFFSLSGYVSLPPLSHFSYFFLFFVFKVCCCSVAQLCPTLCHPVDCSTPGFPVLHHLTEFAQSRVHWVGDAIQPVSQLFASGSQSSFRWPSGASASTSVLPVNIQGWFPLRLTGMISLLSKGLSRAFSSTAVRKH